MKKNLPLRRIRQQISDPAAVSEILDEAKVGSLGFADQGVPYVVPMNFGWELLGSRFCIYIHCAGEGRKLSLLRSGNPVCFETTATGELRPAEKPCDWGISYRSLIGWGKPEEILSVAAKSAALNLIMKKYARREYSFGETEISRTRVFRISLEEMTAKRSSC